MFDEFWGFQMQLAGELSKISLPSLVQLVRNGGLTGEIALAQGAKTATIYVERGRVAHVESDAGTGREAFLDLFLWMTGTFSFIERNIGDIVRTIPADEPMDRLLREGVAYLEQKRYLDQLRINGQTVLRPTAAARQAREVPLLDMIDGRKTLAEALADSRMSRREYIQAVYRLISDGLAVVADSEVAESADRVSLPGWVVARLRQDNADLSQAIINMVIWVDRVKCWMYQADADLGRIMEELLAESAETVAPPPPEFTEPEPIPPEPAPPPLASDKSLSAPAPTATLSSLLKSSQALTPPTVGSFPGGASDRSASLNPQPAAPPNTPPQQHADPAGAPPPQLSAREAMRQARQARLAQQAQQAQQGQAAPPAPAPTQPIRPAPTPTRRDTQSQPAASPPNSPAQSQQAVPVPDSPAQSSLAAGLQQAIESPSALGFPKRAVPPLRVPVFDKLPPQPLPAPGPETLAAPQQASGAAEVAGQPLPTSAIRPASEAHAAPYPGNTAPPDAGEIPAVQPAEETQDAKEQEQDTATKAAKVDWPKSSIPKKATVDTYPPKPKPSIEF